MNDLMTKSFLSYVELKKQALKDLESQYDVESGHFNPMEEQNLSQFFQEVDGIKTEMEEITNLLSDLQSLNAESKSTLSVKTLRGVRDRMDSNMVLILRKAKIVKLRLEALDKANVMNRLVAENYKEGSSVDRTRMAVTNGLRTKLRDMMNDFQSIRDTVLSDYKEDLKRRYYNATGEEASNEILEKMMSSGGKIELYGTKTELTIGNKERHEAVMDLQRSLNKLHQVFLDMAVLVETQGENLDDIEENVVNAGNYVSGGTNNLYYANQARRRNKKWVNWICGVVIIILLVCIISLFCS